jgi:hypothetical protein
VEDVGCALSVGASGELETGRSRVDVLETELELAEGGTKVE